MRSVVITGVSRGLGAALFDEFHAAGDRVLALGRRFSPAQHSAERAQPQRVRLRQVDLAYSVALPAAAELASFVHDSRDVVLVHNAAVLGPIGAIGTLSPEELNAAVAINLTTPMLLTNALLSGTKAGAPKLDGARPDGAKLDGAKLDGAKLDGAKPDGGRSTVTVLFITSSAARRPPGGWSVYGATKLAAESFFEALAAQHAQDGRVRIVNVDPGGMDTDMQGQVREHARRDVYFPERDRFLARHERGELTQPAAAARQIIADHLQRLDDLTQR